MELNYISVTKTPDNLLILTIFGKIFFLFTDTPAKRLTSTVKNNGDTYLNLFFID